MKHGLGEGNERVHRELDFNKEELQMGGLNEERTEDPAFNTGASGYQRITQRD